MTAPARTALTPMGWIRRNLFRSPADSVVTIVAGALTVVLLYRLIRFVVVTGRWSIVDDNLALFLHLVWPADQVWRVAVTLVALAAGFGLLVGAVSAASPAGVGAGGGAAGGGAAGGDAGGGGVDWASLGARARDLGSRLWPILVSVVLMLVMAATPGPVVVVVGIVVAFVAARFAGLRLAGAAGADQRRLLTTAVAGLLVLVSLAMILLLTAAHPLDSWGGVMINLFLALFSITLCFPLGVMLALGRRSSLPVVRGLATVYIELFRGVPLFVLLLMANVALGFFVPQSLTPGTAVRAIVVFILFTAAYVAEIVRGGLQSVPRGQIEAGRALGLSPFAVTRRIVLPQALRNVIPALVGQFISLFKDTTLAGAAMGLLDLLASAEASTAQEAFRGQQLLPEALAFVMLLFWAGSYTMSNESQRLERRLGVGTR